MTKMGFPTVLINSDTEVYIQKLFGKATQPRNN